MHRRHSIAEPSREDAARSTTPGLSSATHVFRPPTTSSISSGPQGNGLPEPENRALDESSVLMVIWLSLNCAFRRGSGRLQLEGESYFLSVDVPFSAAVLS